MVWWWITFSITFEKSVRRETGQNLFGSVFEAFLYNGLSLVILKSKRNFEFFIERLYSFDICKAKTSASSFKNLVDKLYIPAALSGFVSLSNFKISSFEVVK